MKSPRDHQLPPEQLPITKEVGLQPKDSLDNTWPSTKCSSHPHRHFKARYHVPVPMAGMGARICWPVYYRRPVTNGPLHFASPERFRERIRVNGTMVSEAFVVDLAQHYVEANKTESIQPSFFELTVIMAFEYFASEEVMSL